MRAKTLLSLLICTFFSSFFSPGAWSAKKPFLVVIDPGHGGSDHGAVYQRGKFRVSEKEVVLGLAKEVANELKKQKIKTVLTRGKDIDLDLMDRTALANRMGADLFISLHMNSSHRKHSGHARGIETYILNNSSSASSRRLADLENMVMKGSAAQKAENEHVDLILKDLIIDANLPQSKYFACTLQSEVVRATRTQTKNRGVKQALFYVLLGADMPSVLIETGFLNNAQDRALVTQKASRKRVAQAIAQSIVRYRKYEGTPIAQKTLSRCQVR